MRHHRVIGGDDQVSRIMPILVADQIGKGAVEGVLYPCQLLLGATAGRGVVYLAPRPSERIGDRLRPPNDLD